MLHVWSGLVICSLVYFVYIHVPDSDMCKPINARMHETAQ